MIGFGLFELISDLIEVAEKSEKGKKLYDAGRKAINYVTNTADDIINGEGPKSIAEDRSDSITLDYLYKVIFPFDGAPDDNNSYIDLPGNEINTIQLSEPSLGVSDFFLTEKMILHDKNNVSYKYAYRIPLVSIENYIIPQVDICAFKLDYRDFLPTVMVEFMDTSNSLLSTNIPKDGSIIKVYIGGHGDELYYKPIRQDFVLTSIKKIGGSTLKYRINGKLNVPFGYRRDSWCDGEKSARQTLFYLSVWMGLGFATNFTKAKEVDKMNWQNDENSSYFEFIQNVTDHACYSPNTFFTSFIDQYNVLNFVECHSLLSHGGKKTDIPAIIYKCYPPQNLPPFNPEKEQKTPQNQLPLEDGDDPLKNRHQKLSYYYLTNDEFFDGWTNYIEEYHELNNSGTSLSDGFMVNVKYIDSEKSEWSVANCDFLIRPIDNLKRNPSDQRIESIPDEVSQDSYIPLNLMQMTNEDYIKTSDTVDNMTKVQKLVDFGHVDTSNTFKLYYFAEVQNSYQMKCMKKCGLRVKLQNYNPAVTKFSRVWVDIYDRHPLSNNEISQDNTVDKNLNANYVAYKNAKNDNIIQFEDEGVIEEIYPRKYTQEWPKPIFNRSLSGWYVVTEIEIFYEPKDNNLKMDLMLNRIEYKPCFKTDYKRAKAAIDKYKDENIPEQILRKNT